MYSGRPSPSLESRALPLKLLGAAGFLSSAGARMVDPLQAQIASDFNTSVSAVSVVLAAFSVSYAVLQLVLGPLSDSFGRVRVLLFALLGFTTCTGGCAFATGIPSLTILRACTGAAGAGLIPVCLAHIGDAVPYERRQIVLSRFLFGVMWAQTITGPLSGALGQCVGWRGTFLMLAATALLVTAALRMQAGRLPDSAAPRNIARRNYAALLRDPEARFLLLATLIEGSIVAGIVPFIAPCLHESFGLSYASAGMVLACFGLGALAYGRAAHHLVPRLGEAGMVLAGASVMAIAAAAAATARSWVVLIAVEFALGLGYFMLHTVLQARATELLPEARSTAVSGFVFMLLVGQSLGALAAGIAIGWGGYSLAFAVDGALFGLFAVALSAAFRRRSA